MNTKKPFFPIFIILYCLGTLYSSPMQGQQRDTQKEYNVDSTLYAYYMRCKAEVSSPITVQMSDTLFHYAINWISIITKIANWTASVIM